jgi:hypothetical protein
MAECQRGDDANTGHGHQSTGRLIRSAAAYRSALGINITGAMASSTSPTASATGKTQSTSKFTSAAN